MFIPSWSFIWVMDRFIDEHHGFYFLAIHQYENICLTQDFPIFSHDIPLIPTAQPSANRRYQMSCEDPMFPQRDDQWKKFPKRRLNLAHLVTVQGGAPVRERVQLAYKYYFTRVYGGYIYSYWEYKPTYNWGGTTLHTFAHVFVNNEFPIVVCTTVTKKSVSITVFFQP